MKQRREPPLIDLHVDASQSIPLHLQLYGQLRQAILRGAFKPGTRLQSTRQLASELKVSRNTVASAYEQLLAEGYIAGRIGSGTYVSSAIPDELLFTHTKDLPERGRDLSLRGKLLVDTILNISLRPAAFRPFSHGVPALAEFPFEEWQQLALRRWHDPTHDVLDYGSPAGHRGLRESIAEYLISARAVKCEPDQIIIVSGAQQGIDVVCRLLIDTGDPVWMEDPGYLAARAAFASAGAQVIPVPVDEEGIDVAEGEKLSATARLVYVTPSHQYPIGVTMSLTRRLALLEWASRSGAWIIEDDYDSDYRYSGRPLPALQGLDAEGRVIYIGTFSKVLLPALRLGYVVVPRDLVSSFLAARDVLSRSSQSMDQAILSDFMRSGQFTRHIRRMRQLYAKRQSVLLQAANSELGDLLEIRPEHSGIHLVGWLPPKIADTQVSVEAHKEGVESQPLSAYSMRKLKRGGLVLGYAAFSENEIRVAIQKLGVVLKRMNFSGIRKAR